MAKSPSVLSFVEAKRVRSGGSFQPGQLAKEYLAVCREAQSTGRRPLLLLVLPKEPPIRVSGGGTRAIHDELLATIGSICPPATRGAIDTQEMVANSDQVIAYTTWDEIAKSVLESSRSFQSADDSVVSSVRRLADVLQNAIDWHGLQFESKLDA